jgi:hypothetical protein
MAGPTKTKKGVLGRTVQKTTTTEVTEPKGPKGKAYGTVTSEKDVFNKRGNLVKSTSKERDINTGKLNKVNKFNYKKEWFKTGGTIKPKAKKK